MIKTIIFDIGNVLTDYDWKGFFGKFHFDEEMLDRISRATVKSAAWDEYDRGKLTDEEVVERFVENDPGIEKELRETFADINGIVKKRDYAIPWIKRLKENGYQVLVLSNFSHKAYTDCADALDFLPYTDGGILSFRENVIKPEPEIYSLILSRYGLQPEECVFLDDMERNLTAAAAFGIRTILFQSREQAETDLRRLGVNCQDPEA